MNATIRFLTLGLSLSRVPLLSINQMSQKTNTRIISSRFSRFAGPLFSACATGSYLFKSTNFNNFLGHAIDISAVGYAQLKYETAQTFSSTDIHLVECQFQSCTSKSEGGGANIKADSVEIKQCIFFGCNSDERGGAFSVTSSKTTIEQTCIHKCSAHQQGLGFVLRAEMDFDNFGRFEFSDSVIIDSMREGDMNFDSDTMMIEHVDIIMKQANITRNLPSRGSAAFTVMQAGKIQITLSVFEHNSGSGMFIMRMSREKLICSKCNFIGNKIQKEMFALSAMTKIEDCFFLKNLYRGLISGSTGKGFTVQVKDCLSDNWGKYPDYVIVEGERMMGKHDTMNLITQGPRDYCVFGQQRIVDMSGMKRQAIVIMGIGSVALIFYLVYVFMCGSSNGKSRKRIRPGATQINDQNMMDDGSIGAFQR